MKEIIGKMTICETESPTRGRAHLYDEKGSHIDAWAVYGSLRHQQAEAESWLRRNTDWSPGGMASLYWYTDSNGVWTRTVHRKPDRQPGKIPASISGWPVVRAVPFASRTGENRYLALVIADRGDEYAERGRFVVAEASSADGMTWHGHTGHYDLSSERAAEVFDQRKAKLGGRIGEEELPER